MPFTAEFPDFDPATLPALPPGFEDRSWRNDQCPCFEDAAGRVLWVDYADPAAREFPELPRFHLQRPDLVTIVLTDSWSDVLAAL